MSTHLQLANSTTMAILCGITILIVLLQPVIFYDRGIQNAEKN